MKVAEIFGNNQGEGINIGKPTIFIRFSGCNLNCKWCDSKYHKNGKLIPVEAILDEICASLVDNITLTGGEPLVQCRESLIDLCNGIHKLGKKVYIETNGSIFDKKLFNLIDFWTISPKLQFNYFEKVLKTYVKKAYFLAPLNKIQLKFVVNEKTFNILKNELIKFKEYGEAIKEAKIPIIIQPQANNKFNLLDYSNKAKKLLEKIQNEEFLYNFNWRFIIQQHKILYGNRKGV